MLTQNQEFLASAQFEEIQINTGERYLLFPLNSQVTSLLPLSELQGTIDVVLKDILPVPHVGESWLGIINWRGEAIWILDLANFLGGSHWYRQKTTSSKGMAILIKVGTQTIGLLVKEVNTIESYPSDELLPVMESMIPKRQQQFFGGYFLDSKGQPLLVLNIPNLVKALK